MKKLAVWRNWFLGFAIVFGAHPFIMMCMFPKNYNPVRYRDFWIAVGMLLTAAVLHITKSVLQKKLEENNMTEGDD